MSSSPAPFDRCKLFRSVLALLGSGLLLGGIEINAATITWSGAAGDSLWSNPLNWIGGSLPTSVDDVVIDVPGSVTVRMNVPDTTVRSLQCQESFLVESSYFTVTAGASVINGAFRMKAGLWLVASGPTTVLTVNGAVTNVSGLRADSGAVISLPSARKLTINGTTALWLESHLNASGAGSAILMPNLTDLVIAPNYYMAADAFNGGLIDLRQLRVPKGPINVFAQGSNSTVDLSGMAGLWTQAPEYTPSYRYSSLYAKDGGTVLIPNVTAMEKVDVYVSMTNVSLAQIRSFSAGSLSLTSRTNGFDALTNFSGLLYAYDHTRLDWTNFTSLYATNSFLRIEAHQDSVIQLPQVTNVVVSAPNSFLVEAGTGGRINLSGLRAQYVPLYVTALDAGSVVDLSGLTGEWHAPGSIVQAQEGGSVLIPGVTAMREMFLDLRDDGNVPTAQIRSFSAGTLALTSRTNGFDALTNFDGTLLAYNTRLDWTNFTLLSATNSDLNIKAYQGSVVQLPRVTNVVISAPYRFVVEAGTGGRINLSGLRAQDGPLTVTATDAGSVVDLSGLTGEWVAPGSVVQVWNGGSLLIPGVTAMRNLSLELRYDAMFPTAQIRSMVDCSLTIYGRTNGFENLTNFTSSLSLRDHSRIDWTNFTVLNGTDLGLTATEGSCINLSRVTNVIATGGYSLVALAFSGGRIDLSRLRQMEGLVLAAWASDPDSVVNLSSLSGVLRNGLLRADHGGTVLIPSVTALEGFDYDVRGDATISLTQLTSFIDGRLQLESRTNDLAALTNFTGWLYAVDTRLDLTNLTVLYATNRSLLFESSEGSVINLSSVTNVVISPGYLLKLTGYGGQIDLRRARVPEGTLNVEAAGFGGVVDLSGLSGLWTPGPGHANSTVLSWSGGSVLLSNVTAMRRIDLAQQYNAILPMAQLSSFTEGSIATTARTNVFAALTNFDGSLSCSDGRAEFPVLTRLGTTGSILTFTANAGGVIDLSQVTNPVVGSGNSLSLRALYNGRIALPHVEGIDVNDVEVLADGLGAVVDLSGLTGLFSDNNSGTLVSRGGGTVLLNTNAILLAGVAVDLQSNPSSVLPPYLAASQSLVLYGRPWESYRVESRDPLVAGSPWSTYARVPLTAPQEILGPRPPVGALLRVNLMLADPPEVSIRRAGSDQVEVILFGIPGHTYSLSSKTTLEAGIWENGPTNTLINSFQILPAAGATNAARFFRARSL